MDARSTCRQSHSRITRRVIRRPAGLGARSCAASFCYRPVAPPASIPGMICPAISYTPEHADGSSIRRIIRNGRTFSAPGTPSPLPLAQCVQLVDWPARRIVRRAPGGLAMPTRTPHTPASAAQTHQSPLAVIRHRTCTPPTRYHRRCSSPCDPAPRSTPGASMPRACSETSIGPRWRGSPASSSFGPWRRLPALSEAHPRP